MLRRVLVPVDFSPASACAVAVARDYRPAEATLRLLHVVGPGDLAATSNASLVDPVCVADIGGDSEAQALERLRSWVRPDEELAVEVGRTAERIRRHADRWEADLIVIGTAARSGIAQFLHGSATEWLVRHARQPVLAVHEVELDGRQRAYLPDAV